MKQLLEFIGDVTAIKDVYQTNNYSFVLERQITLKNEEKEVDFIINRFTKMKQGSFFEVGDSLRVLYEEDSLYPCFKNDLFEAEEVWVASCKR